ncbi:MAG: hypothetical protein R3C30_00995 [Hyphomonadaceae bacterium]
MLHAAVARARGFAPDFLDRIERDVGSLAPHADLRDARVIGDASLDVIVDLRRAGGAPIDAGLARLGVWRLATRRGASHHAGPLGFWDYYRGEPLVEVCVLARTAGGGEAEVATACYSGFPWSWSVNDTLLGVRAAWLFEDALRKTGVARAVRSDANWRERSVWHVPAAAAKTVARIAAEAAERAVSDDRWRILLAKGDPLTRRTDPPTTIVPPSHSYWADPFVLVKDGRHHIFFEEYFYATRRGVISHVCVDELRPGETLRGLPSKVIIDQPHHLSYPFVFTHDNAIFMIPESSAAGVVEVWQATDFPHGWTRVATPLSGVSAADSSLLEWNGRWWLFTNLDRSGSGDHRSELHVFHAPDPIAGPWTPHPANPVVADARCGRMAGGFLKAADGRPIRCGQVQGRKYGEKVSYRLVTELSETAYAEESIANIEPIPVAPGARTHHVATHDGVIVVDECFVVPKWQR